MSRTTEKQLVHERDLLVEVLGNILVAAGVIRQDVNMTGPMLLCVAEEFAEHLVQTEPKDEFKISKKKYFINVSFSTSNFNKFAYSIVELDLSVDLINEAARNMIKPECEKLGVDVLDVDINVTAFNRV